MTTGLIYALPPAAIYYTFKRYMVGGLTAGAVKSLTAHSRDGHGIRLVPEHRKVLRHARRSSTASRFDIQDGEFMVLVGPSGCGKSTLLRMLAGLEEISGGTIAIDGKTVNDVDSKDRDIAMVFQSYALYPHMTVRDNMGFSLKLRKADADGDRPSASRKRREDPQPRPVPRPLSARALRRPAPARRDGPRDRPRSQGVPVRRAAVEPRRQAARRDARGDQGAAPAAQDDDRLRDARPDRGDDDGRPHRRHARRPHRADRRAARALRPAGQPVRRAVHRLAGDEHRQRHAAPRATAARTSRRRAACAGRSARAPAPTARR